MKKLTAFFPGLGEGKKSPTAAGWKAALLIDFHSDTDEKNHVLRVTVNRDYDTWSEGNGDWGVKPGLEKFVSALIEQEKGKRDRPFLKEYRGDVELPEALYETYVKLIDAIGTQENGNIEKYCLPKAIKITSEDRPAGTREYSQDTNEMNLPFLKKGFQKEIQVIRKDEDGSYLIRTNSSVFYFIETKTAGWKLFRYYDKPIE
jgi:hypothetical protein